MRGTITKYKRDGVVKSWGYYFRRKDDAGVWKQITKGGFLTKREAEHALREALEGFGLKPAEEPPMTSYEAALAEPTFSELLDVFLEEAAIDCSLGTVEAYRKQSRYPRRDLGEFPINTITTEQLQLFFGSLRTEGGDKGRPLSAKTLKHFKHIVKCVFDVAIQKKILTVSPLNKDVKLPRVKKKKLKMPEAPHLLTAIERSRGTRLYPVLEVTAATGCRLGEIAALQWTDYDEVTGEIEITKSLEETRLGIRIKDTKSEEPRRLLIGPRAMRALAEHRQVQAKDRALFGNSYRDHNYIFCPPEGGHYRPSRLSSRIGAFLKKHGIHLSMHGLRHAHASYLLSKGESLAAVSERLGHADPAITNAIYHQFIPSSGERLARRWDEILETRQEKPRVVEMLGDASNSKKRSA